MKNVICIVAFLFCFQLVNAQDLNARVQVLTPKIQTTNKRVFQVLENALKDFLNGRKWSADQILPQERIDCNFILNVTAWDGSSNYSAELQVQSTRPVYGTTYNSTLLNVNDKDFDFTYTEGQLIDFNDQNFQSNLSSVLAFYAYIIVGMDYDSFSRFGGSPYFAKAQTVVSTAQNASSKGWNATDNTHDRYWISENFNSKSYAMLRDFIYDYHRNGLDLMSTDAGKGRHAIDAALPKLSQVDRQNLGAILPQLFFSAKSDELVSIYSAGDPQEKTAAYNILNAIDPSNGNKYQALQRN
jgi:hypothetical protein